MYGKKEHLESLTSYVSGRNHESLYERWHWGTPDQAAHAAVTATIDYLKGLGDRFQETYRDRFSDYQGRVKSLKMAFHAIEQYEKELSRAMLEGFDDVPGLPQMPDITFLGVSEPDRLDERDPTFAFQAKVKTPEEVEKRLVEEYHIAIRAIEFWSMAEDFFKLERLPLRASLVHYNTLEEVHYFLRALQTVLTE